MWTRVDMFLGMFQQVPDSLVQQSTAGGMNVETRIRLNTFISRLGIVVMLIMR
jgi:hypothetical protein